MSCHHQWRKDVCIICGELMSEQPDNDWDYSRPPRPKYAKPVCDCGKSPCTCQRDWKRQHEHDLWEQGW